MNKESYFEFLLKVETKPNARKLVINQWAYNMSEIRKQYNVGGSPEKDFEAAVKLYETDLLKAKEYQKAKIDNV